MNSDSEYEELQARWLARKQEELNPHYVVNADTGRMTTNALKAEYRNDYSMPTTSRTRRGRSTLDRGMRVGQRSIKHRKHWQDSVQERSVLRYTTET